MTAPPPSPPGRSRPVVGPADARVLPPTRRWADRAVAALDRVGLPITEQLARRRLHGLLHDDAPPRARPARQLLGCSFDLDYQEDTDALDRLVRCLDDAGATATMFSIGRLVAADPDPYARALDAGHELGNHTWSHPDNPVLCPDREWWDLTVDDMAEEVVRAQDAFAAHLGVRPAGFRTPHFKDAHRMLDALERVEELRWLSSVLVTATPTGLPYHPSRAQLAGELSHRVAPSDPAAASRLLQLPLTACPDHRWSQLCSYHTIRTPRDDAAGQGFHPLPGATDVFRRALRRAVPAGYAAVYLDPKDVCRDEPTARWFTELLAAARSDGWEVVAFGELAEAWAPYALPRPTGGP